MAPCVVYCLPTTLVSYLDSSQFLFNNLVAPPQFLRPPNAPVLIESEDQEGESTPIFSDDPLDETARLPADLGQGGFDVVPTEGQGHGVTRR
jgi:hypothetical protein